MVLMVLVSWSLFQSDIMDSMVWETGNKSVGRGCQWGLSHKEDVDAFESHGRSIEFRCSDMPNGRACHSLVRIIGKPWLVTLVWSFVITHDMEMMIMIMIVIMIMIEVSSGISMQFSERFAGAWYVFVGAFPNKIGSWACKVSNFSTAF